jgi:hypothetical protein
MRTQNDRMQGNSERGDYKANTRQKERPVQQIKTIESRKRGILKRERKQRWIRRSLPAVLK